MNYTKKILLIFVVLSSLTFVSASTCPVGVAYCNENIPFINTAPSTGQLVDNTTFYSNNSQYLQGLTPQQVANLYNENDTLQTVTNRGNTTTNNITIQATNSQLTVNRNTQPLGAGALSGTGVRLNCADNEQCRYGITSYGIAGMSGFSARSARGTGASPTASQANDVLGQFDAYGRSTSAWAVTPKGMIKVIAVDNYTDTSQGTKLEFWTTPSGTVVPVRSMIINDGNITMYGNLTANTLNLNYTQNAKLGTGTIVDSGTGTITGTGTKFLTELQVGDIIFESDYSIPVGVTSIIDNTTITVNGNSQAAGGGIYIYKPTLRSSGSASFGDGTTIITKAGDLTTTNILASTISFSSLRSSNGIGDLAYYTSNNPNSFGPTNGANPYVTDLGNPADSNEWSDLYLTGNATIGKLIKLGRITLSTCNTAINGSIGRNATGVYYCNGTIWNNLLFSNYIGSTDTLQTVTDRGAITTNPILINVTSNSSTPLTIKNFLSTGNTNNTMEVYSKTGLLDFQIDQRGNGTFFRRLEVGNVSAGFGRGGANTLLTVSGANACARIDGQNSNNYVDYCYGTSVGYPYISTPATTFAYFLGSLSSRGFVISSNAVDSVNMAGSRNSATGTGVTLQLKGGDTNDFNAGNLNIRAGNTTNNRSKVGYVYFKDAYDDLNFLIIDSVLDRMNLTGIINFVNTTTYFDNIKNYYGDSNDASIYYNTTDLVINPKEVGTGKVHIQGETMIGDTQNFTDISSTGDIRLYGNATQWDDLVFPLISGTTPATNPPTLNTFQGTVKAYSFANAILSQQNQLYATLQMSHSYKNNTAIDCHIHWVCGSTDANNVTWGLEVTKADIGGTFPTTTTYYVNQTCGTAFVHNLADFHSIGTFNQISGLAQMRIFRASADAGDTYTGDDVFGLSLDCHYEKDSLGSNQEYVKY